MPVCAEDAAGEAAPPPLPRRRPLHLDARRGHALFDLLMHYETYQEIQDFKDPATVAAYGFPFVQESGSAGGGSTPPPADTGADTGAGANAGTDANTDASTDAGPPGRYAPHSQSPILHLLLNTLVLSLPPAQTLPPAFWRERVQGLLTQLAEAELSESYDQGAMGTRKLLATASSVLLELVGRGVLGGLPRPVPVDLRTAAYNMADAGDFSRAWDDVLHTMVYGDLVDELFSFCAEHQNIEEHSTGVRAAVDYIIVHLAEFLHYLFIRSPNGRYLTRLVETVQQLVPYALIRQTLRVSNAATMINAMMRLLLAKLSVGGLTNWIGLTSAADDGMNLMQRVISLALSYDASNFKKAADKIEKAKDGGAGPLRTHLAAIRDHLARPRAVHDAVRRESMVRGWSAVAVVLHAADPALLASLTDAQHAQCARYYAALLAVHDRRALTSVFCRQTPDLFTQAARDLVAASDPIIRRIHDKIDLKEHLADLEGFINQFIEVTRGRRRAKTETTTAAAVASSGDPDNNDDGNGRVLPTVKDYVALLRNNRHLLYKWLHRVAHDTPDIRDMFRGWAVRAVRLFRGPAAQETGETGGGSDAGTVGASAGNMDADLARLFATLPADTQAGLLPLLDAHVAYLEALRSTATQQRQALLDQIYHEGPRSASPTPAAPGAGPSLARWQALLDETPIGPATAEGPLRCGRDVALTTGHGKGGSGGSGGESGGRERVAATGLLLQPPDTRPVADALCKQFRALLSERYDRRWTG